MLARVTSCIVDHGATSEAPHGGTVTEHYSGRVSVHDTTFEQTAHAETSFAITWPDAEVSTHATLDLVADSTAYDVTVDLVARDGDDVVASRRWHERIARDLA